MLDDLLNLFAPATTTRNTVVECVWLSVIVPALAVLAPVLVAIGGLVWETVTSTLE